MSVTVWKILLSVVGVLATLLLLVGAVEALRVYPLPSVEGWKEAAWMAAGGSPLQAWGMLLLQAMSQIWVLWLIPVVGVVGVLYSWKLIPDEAIGFYVERVYVLERLLAETSAREEKLADVWQSLNMKLDQLFEGGSELWIVCDREGRVRRWNHGVLEFFRRWLPALHVVEGMGVQDIFPGFLNTPLHKALYEAGTGKVWYGEVPVLQTEAWLLAWVFPLGDDVAMVLRDVSHRHKPEASLQTSTALVRQLVEDSWRPVAVLDENFKYLHVSRRWNQVLGFADDVVFLGQEHTRVVPGFPKDFGVVRQQLLSGESVGREDERRLVNGKEEILAWHLRPWRDAYGRPAGYIFGVTNVTDIVRLKAQVSEAMERENALAYNDMLTGLPNRQLFHDRLNVALAQAYRQLGKVAILFLDLDGFKQVNDKLGHDYGDMLLKQVADRLKGCVRNSDTVARLGGDEFTIIMSIRGKEDAEWVAKKVLEIVHAPYKLGEHDVTHVGTSIGIAMYPLDGTQAVDLIQKADSAMYAAKKGGKNTYRFAMDLPRPEDVEQEGPTA